MQPKAITLPTRPPGAPSGAATPGELQKFEGALLGREDVFLEDGGGPRDGNRCEVGEEGAEAVDRQAVVGAAGGLLAGGGVGARRLGDDAGALFGGIGVILGFPLLLTIGAGLYELQDKALEAQIKANEAQLKVVEAQVKAVEAQNSMLRETQYDRALALIKSQKEVFLIERADLEKKISDLTASGTKTEELATLKSALNVTNNVISVFEKCVTTKTSISSNAPKNGILEKMLPIGAKAEAVYETTDCTKTPPPSTK